MAADVRYSIYECRGYGISYEIEFNLTPKEARKWLNDNTEPSPFGNGDRIINDGEHINGDNQFFTYEIREEGE